MIRELREERGISCSVHDLERWQAVRIAGFELSLYFVHRWSGELANCDPGEHDEIRWLTLAELEHALMARPKLLQLLRAALSHDRCRPSPPESSSSAIAFQQFSLRTRLVVLALADGLSARSYARQKRVAIEGVRATLRETRRTLGLSTQRRLIDWFRQQTSRHQEQALPAGAADPANQNQPTIGAKAAPMSIYTAMSAEVRMYSRVVTRHYTRSGRNHQLANMPRVQQQHRFRKPLDAIERFLTQLDFPSVNQPLISATAWGCAFAQ